MKNYLQIVLIVLFAVLYFNKCTTNKTDKKTAKNNAAALLDSVIYYKNKLGLEVAEKKTFQGNAADLKIYFEAEKVKSKQFSEASKNWKKLYNAAVIKLKFKIDSVDIPFKKPVPFKFNRKFYQKTKQYTIAGRVNESGINLDLLATATITPFTGSKKIGIFKTDFKTEITSSSPVLTITDFNNYTFKTKEKRFGLGLSFGVGIYRNGFFIGPSVNYNIIRF
tara:strand:- start:213 stop:878 length:666 start_codon:yes stop_codon:yes gene_type:complete